MSLAVALKDAVNPTRSRVPSQLLPRYHMLSTMKKLWANSERGGHFKIIGLGNPQSFGPHCIAPVRFELTTSRLWAWRAATAPRRVSG